MALKQELSNVRNTVKKQIVSYISAGFGLVAGLAWNDAIRGLIAYFFPQEVESTLAKFIYAILITGVTAIFVYYLHRLILRKGEDSRN